MSIPGLLLAAIALLSSTGCGTPYASLGDGPDGSGDMGADATVGVDAGSDAGSDGGVDAGVDSGADSGSDGGIAALGPFGPATIISAVSDPVEADDDPTLTVDLLELYFCSSRPGGLGAGDIWVSTRPDVSTPWGPPTLVVELSSTFSETTPEVSADGLSIYLSSQRTGGMGGHDVWVSTRPDRSSLWGAPVQVPELSTPFADTNPTPTTTDLMLIIGSRLSSMDVLPTDLYLSTRASTAVPWGIPVIVAELNTPEGDQEAFLSPSGLHVYFASDRPGGMGATDLYLASRPSVSDPFSAPAPVTELNTIDADGDPWLSPDLRYIVFWSNRSGNGEIYEASR